jgi:hypothetical protein
MKNIFFLYSLLLLLLPASRNLQAQVDTTFHIYLMFGQSNMEGAGTPEAQDRVKNPRVWMMQDSTCPNLNRTYGNWYVASPPLNRCWGGLGPGDSFGRLLGEKAPAYVTKIGLINASVSGCNIFIYKKGCPNGLDAASQGIPFGCGYAWLLDLAKKAQQVGVIKGIIFHQGETNNTDTNWKYTVQQIIADLKADLGLGDIPFLAGELLYSEYGSCCGAHNVEINKLPGIIPNTHVISAKGLPGKDYAHFTNASYRTLGERYAVQMLKYVYNICDTTAIESWYQTGSDPENKSQNIMVHSGTSLRLSPRPANTLGTWNWSGAGTSGTNRQQTISFSNEGTYTAYLTYHNECGATSHLPVHILVCDSAFIEPWYKSGEEAWQKSNTVNIRTGLPLLIEARSNDTTGNWSWTGAGTSGDTALQSINTAVAGIYTASAVYANDCGALSRMQVKISVCDSTAITSRYQISGGLIISSDSIRALQHDILTLSPLPSSGGIWEWTGAVSGSERKQQVNTSIPGNYIASVTYTNACGIESRMNVRIYIDAITSVSQGEGKEDFQLFPNPAGNSLTLNSINGMLSAVRQAVIINSAGQTVMQLNLKNAGSELSIDISSLSEGAYYLKMTTEKGVMIKKFACIR